MNLLLAQWVAISSNLTQSNVIRVQVHAEDASLRAGDELRFGLDDCRFEVPVDRRVFFFARHEAIRDRAPALERRFNLLWSIWE